MTALAVPRRASTLSVGTLGAADRRTTVVVGLSALLLFLLLPQRTLHGVDGQSFVTWVEQGSRDYPRHFGYLYCAGLLYRWLQPLGCTAFQALLWLSALGSAGAAAALHRGFVQLQRAAPLRNGPIACTVATMATVPCFFYATCAEIHGVFALGAGASWWAFAWWFRQPTRGRAVVCGAATGIAAALHAFGYLLLPMFGAAALCLRGRRTAALGPLAWAAAGQFTVAGAAAVWAGARQTEAIAAFVGTQLQDLALATTPDVFVREWLIPAAPWSCLALLGLASRRARQWSTASLFALLLHLPVTVLLLGFHRIREHGAYHVAIVPPAVLATAALLPRRWFRGAIAIAAALALWTTAPEWSEPVDPAFVRAVAALQAEHPLVLIGDRGEVEGVQKCVDGILAVDLDAALQQYREEHARGAMAWTWFDGWCQRFERTGRPLLLSQCALDFFVGNADPELRGLWDRHVPTRYVVVPERRSGFRGAWLLPLAPP